MLKVWGRSTSINVQKVMWCVGELELPHERLDVGGAFGGLDKPEFQAMNPNARIPVIDDDGTVVWESNAIVRYLAATYGRDGLWPGDPARRAPADQWMDWMLTTLYPPFIGLFVALVRTPPSKRNPGMIRNTTQALHRCYGMLDAHLAGRDFIAGDRFTMGDIPLGATLYRYHALEIERPRLDNLAAWYERLQSRAAYREHIMTSFESLRVVEA
jgi:glutathione S-transferase